MAATVAPSPVAPQRFVDSNGVALTGGKLFTYAAGTTTKQATYTDASGTTQNTNPVILNSRGEANVFLDVTLAYKFVLAPAWDTDPPGAPIWTVDNIPGVFGSIGSNLVGFQLSATGTVARTAQSKLSDIASWKDFGIVADGVTDDTTAVQNALNWLNPGRTLLMPGAKIKISSTLTFGNGNSTTLSTIGNNSTIIWGGEASDLDSLINTSNPWYATAQSGTQFVWAGTAGGQMFQVNGPIHGLRWIGALTLNGGCVVVSGSGAGSCLKAYSFSSCTIDAIIAVNWQASGQGILLSTVSAATIGGNANPVLSAGNNIGKLQAFSPYGNNGECIRLDGYRAAGGGDFTVSRIGLVQCGISGTGAKGLVLGYVDDIIIDSLVNVTYNAISGSPWGLYLDTVSTPFSAPARVRIIKAAVGQGLTVGGSTGAMVVIDEYELDDGATIPTVTGLYILAIRQTSGADNGMAYAANGIILNRAVGNGDGYYGKDVSGNTFHSLTRQGTASHVQGYGDVEFEAGATGGPTTAKHFKVTTTGAGYPTGVGGAVTQITSRTTGVTLNNVCGQVTLFSAAGSATWVTFTITNSNVAATDVIRLSQASGTDKYMLHVTGVRAGAFDISFATTGGTTTEQPVFNFAVLKASAS